MKRFFIIVSAVVATVLLSVGCHNESVRISGQFVGLNAKTVYLEQMSASGQQVIDSVALAQDGSYHFFIKSVADTPSLYNLIYNNDRIPLLVQRGEDIEVSALGSALINYTVCGSEESELLRTFNKEYIQSSKLGEFELK